MKRALLVAALALVAAGRLAAQEPVPPAPAPDTTRTDTLRVDSLRADSLRLDSLRLDSLRTDSLRADSAAAQPQAPASTWTPGVQLAYRRTPTFTQDPFRYALVPHWGFVLSVGATGNNNSLNFSDVGAIMFLQKKDSLRPVNIVDALGLVPPGKGLLGFVQSGTAFHIGGPFGRHVGLGLSAGAAAYTSFRFDDNTVALLRDGNGARQNFSLGTSGGAALGAAEAGVHVVMRFGATGNETGWRLIAGLGGRYIRPVAFARGGSAISNGGTLRVTGDSIIAHLQMQSEFTYQTDKDPAKVKGSGFATDLLVRFELPQHRAAFEVMLANVGSVKVQGVERRLATINVATTTFQTVQDSVDNVKFRVRDTTNVTVTLPRVLRFAASTWLLPMLQLDAAYTASVSGDFAAPATIEAGATLRLLRWFPLRVGVINASGYGTGLTGGFGFETRVLYFDLTGATLGGGFKTGTGAGARVEFGFFF